jgi:hypothetical protein
LVGTLPIPLGLPGVNVRYVVERIGDFRGSESPGTIKLVRVEPSRPAFVSISPETLFNLRESLLTPFFFERALNATTALSRAHFVRDNLNCLTLDKSAITVLVTTTGVALSAPGQHPV